MVKKSKLSPGGLQQLCEFPETTAGAKAGVATGRLMIWFIDHQPQSFGDFGHGCFSRPYTKLTSFSYYRSKGTSLPQLETRSHRTTCERPFVCSLAKPNGRSTSCAFCFPYYYTYYHIYMSQPKGTTKPTVYYRRQWNPCHMDFWSCLPASH